MKRLTVILVCTILAACQGASNGDVTAPPMESLRISAADLAPVIPHAATDLPYGSAQGINTAPGIQLRGLPSGESRAVAIATDTARLIPGQATTGHVMSLDFSDFYTGYQPGRGLILSEALRALHGADVEMQGYVAPPLTPRAEFFVLTRIYLSTCPFCNNAADWPDDIALVYLPEPRILSSEYPVRVRGRLGVGESTDAETGMVSLVRIYATEITLLP